MERRKDNKGRVLKNGESQRTDGRYTYQYNDFDGKRKNVYAKDLNELRKKEKIIESRISENIYDSDATLNMLFDEYIKHKGNLKERTRENYKSLWDYRVRNSIGDRKIKTINKMMIIKFLKNLQDEGLAYSTLKAYEILISITMEAAIDNNLIIKNPCQNCLNEFNASYKKKMALTQAEQDALTDFIQCNKIYSAYYPMILLMLSTGIRCGEAIGLTWKNIDLEKRELTIDHQLVYQKHDGKYQFYASSPKTATGIRTIPLTRNVAKVIAKWREEQFSKGMRSEREIDGYKDFCFLTKNKNPIMPSAVNNALLNIVNAYNKMQTGITLPHISAHILRHTACTRMSEAGMDPKVMQEIMGHNRMDITMNVYTHVTQERLHEEIKKMDRIRLAV